MGSGRREGGDRGGEDRIWGKRGAHLNEHADAVFVGVVLSPASAGISISLLQRERAGTRKGRDGRLTITLNLLASSNFAFSFLSYLTLLFSNSSILSPSLGALPLALNFLSISLLPSSTRAITSFNSRTD